MFKNLLFWAASVQHVQHDLWCLFSYIKEPTLSSGLTMFTMTRIKLFPWKNKTHVCVWFFVRSKYFSAAKGGKYFVYKNCFQIIFFFWVREEWVFTEIIYFGPTLVWKPQNTHKGKKCSSQNYDGHLQTAQCSWRRSVVCPFRENPP